MIVGIEITSDNKPPYLESSLKGLNLKISKLAGNNITQWER